MNTSHNGNSNNRRRQSSVSAATGTTTVASGGGGESVKMDATRLRISQMEQEREERRRSMIQRKEARRLEQEKNLAAGNPGDVDFIGMVEAWRIQQAASYKKKQAHNLTASASSNICIAVRKRPISAKEKDKLDHDSVSCFPPTVTIHSAKFKVDGITKYLTHNSFQFDHAFAENATTQDIYVQTTLPLVDHVVSTQGRATVFCYGQTGSGKTFTMNGIQQILAYDLYAQLQEATPNGGGYETTVAFFELYGGFIQDLLHQRQRCKLLEDGKGEVNITGLQEVPAPTPDDFLRVLSEGNSLRTTHTTEANDTSSRSHAICQVLLRQNGKLMGKLSLVDLAGSERGSDTKSHNSQRRAESADINTSLLSLKECIRALGQNSAHVPYRGSKLTLILKDCFSPDSKTTMIATVSPGASSTDHSLNTLRYADRIKEQRTTTTAAAAAAAPSIKAQGGTNNKLPHPPSPPSKPRLQRIANANALAKARRNETPLAAQEQNTVMSINKNSPASYIMGDNNDCDEDLLLTDSGGAPTQEGAAHLLEEEGDEDDDEDYVPSDDDDDLPSDEAELDSFFDAEERIEEKTTIDDEEEMRRVVQALFELEEALLNQHMSNIQEHAEMLTQEGKLLHSIDDRQRNNDVSVSEEEMDDYAIQLAEYLDRKEILIYKLQQKLGQLKNQLAKEQQMAQRVHTLSQY